MTPGNLPTAHLVMRARVRCQVLQRIFPLRDERQYSVVSRALFLGGRGLFVFPAQHGPAACGRAVVRGGGERAL